MKGERERGETGSTGGRGGCGGDGKGKKEKTPRAAGVVSGGGPKNMEAAAAAEAEERG